MFQRIIQHSLARNLSCRHTHFPKVTPHKSNDEDKACSPHIICEENKPCLHQVIPCPHITCWRYEEVLNPHSDASQSTNGVGGGLGVEVTMKSSSSRKLSCTQHLTHEDPREVKVGGKLINSARECYNKKWCIHIHSYFGLMDKRGVGISVR